MPTRKPRRLVLRSPAAKTSEILDVHMTAELLTASTDTVYRFETAPGAQTS